jgi:hypothetical protein
MEILAIMFGAPLILILAIAIIAFISSLIK